MAQRIILVALVLAAAIAFGVVALVRFGGSDPTPELRASAYPQLLDAPVTTGTDHLGNEVTVPQKGRPALVTFLFANCPTVCPVVANSISVSLEKVPEVDRDAIDIVAISVDPEGDTRPAVTKFLDNAGMTGRMRYIVGTREELAPMWREWQVQAQPEGDATASLHTARLVLIDAKGRQVASYPGGLPIKPDDLAADISTLVNESR